MEAKFEGCKLKHIGRASNEEVDTLENIGSTCSAIPVKVKTSTPPIQSVTDSGAALLEAEGKITTGPSQQVLLLEPMWTKPFLAYLLRQELPDDLAEARRIVRRLKAYTVVAGELYKRSISGIFQ